MIWNMKIFKGSPKLYMWFCDKNYGILTVKNNLQSIYYFVKFEL